MIRTALSLFALLAVLGACSSDVETRDELLARMTDRYDANRGAVGGFVVTAGGWTATHGALPDSSSALDPPQIAPLAGEPDPGFAALLGQQVANVRLLADTLRTATMEGPVDRRGHRVYVLANERPDGRSLYVVVDAETFDVREIEQSIRADSLERPVVTRIVYDNFQTVDGLTLPFRVKQFNEGIDQFIPLAERMYRGGQARVALGSIDLMPPGATRNERKADLEREVRLYIDGEQETDLAIDGVTVTPKAR